MILLRKGQWEPCQQRVIKVILFPSAPPNLQPKYLNPWGNAVTQVVLPRENVCRGFSQYQGVSLAAGTSQQPLRCVETDPLVRPELPLSSALLISTRISSPHGALAQNLPESSQYPDSLFGAVPGLPHCWKWSSHWALLSPHLTKRGSEFCPG